jgi:hypothetical protein
VGRTGEYTAFNNGIHLYFEYGDNLSRGGCAQEGLIYYPVVYNDVLQQRSHNRLDIF